MKLDLYYLYKQFYQRSHRSPENEDLAEMTELARDMARITFLGTSNDKITPESYPQILSMATKLQALEIDYAPRNLFSKFLVKAIENKNYCSNVPYERRHLWQDNHNALGYVYLFTSNSKYMQVKIGATYLDPFVRAAKYSSKFGYSVSVKCYARVSNPFHAEKALVDIFRSFRVSGNTWGDSNEWYFMKLLEAKKRFNDYIKSLPKISS